MKTIVFKRWLTLLFSVLAMLTAGSLFTFSAFSKGISDRFGYTSANLNIISGVGLAGLYVPFLFLGPLYDFFGVKKTMVIAALTYFLGYILMYLAFKGSMGSNVSFGLIALFYFIAGTGGSASYMAAIGINIVNFPSHFGNMVVGFLIIFYGLSSTFYSQIYSNFYAGKSAEVSTGAFLLFLALSVLVINGAGYFTMFKLPWEFDNAKEGKDSKSTANNNIKIDPEAPSPVNEQEHPSLNTGAWGDLSPCNDSASPNSDAPLISSNIIVKEGEVSTNINNTGTVASRISACILPEVPDANRTSSSQLSPVVTQPASVKTEGIDENAKGESPLQILKNPTLWLFTITFILQQGLTYITNLSTILTAAAPESLQQDPLALQTYISLHVTIMSVCQSIGPIIGILPGLLEIILARFGKKWTPPEPDQSIALMLDEFLFLIPHLLLALVPNPSPAILILCTVLIGTGTGMASMIFPTLTRDLFGTKYYGTACGFVLGGVPIGILSSNEIYGYFLDKQTAQQYSEIASSNSSNDCYGSACFSKYFAVAVGIQFVALSLSIALYFIKRSRDRKAKLRVTSEGQHMNK